MESTPSKYRPAKTNKDLISKIYQKPMQLNNKKSKLLNKKREYTNRHFLKDDNHMANKHRKRCLTLLIIREMQMKITMKCNFTPGIMVIIKKSENNKLSL